MDEKKTKTNEKLLPFLLKFISSSEDPFYRHHGAEGLGDFPEPRAISALVSVLGDNERGNAGDNGIVGNMAVISLAKIGRLAIPSLSDALQSRDHYVRRRALDSLVMMTDPATFPVIAIAAMDDFPEVWSKASEILAKQNASKDAIIYLQSIARHAPERRKACMAGIERVFNAATKHNPLNSTGLESPSQKIEFDISSLDLKKSLKHFPMANPRTSRQHSQTVKKQLQLVA